MINIDPRDGETVQNILSSIFKLYQDYFSEVQKKQIIDEAYDLFNRKVKFNSSSIEEMLEKIQNQRKFYYFDFFLHILFIQIHNQDIFTSKFSNIFQDFGPNSLLRLNHDNSFHDMHGYYIPFFDKSMNFYLRKRYTQELSTQLQIREQQILTKNLSKFLITISDIDENSILVPYYPMGTLYSILYHKQSQTPNYPIKLSMVDKTIILLEIASALKDMHFYGQCHGNLSSKYIYLNSSKDAYIGSICHDRKVEMFQTLMNTSFYTRAPENLIWNNDLDYNKAKSCDIYSFGVIMYEILSENTTQFIFRKKKLCRNDIHNIIQNYYVDFLFSGENNKIFEDDSMNDYKNIIQKCMKYDANERYSSFIEIIDSIKSSRIYMKNKEEIDFRFHNAIDSDDYKCNLSDIFESYLRGNLDCRMDILSIAQFFYRYFGEDFNQIINNKDCDIYKALFDALNLQEKDE